MAVMGSNTAIDPNRLSAVERGDIARSVVATGKIELPAKVEVKSKASGLVKQIFVDYGDTVKQGQVLVELDKEELQARVPPFFLVVGLLLAGGGYQLGLPSTPRMKSRCSGAFQSCGPMIFRARRPCGSRM